MTHLNAEGDERIQDYLVPSIAGDKVGALHNRTYGGSDVAGMRTTAVRKGINMLLMDQNIYYEWCLCGLLYCCRQNKTRYNKGISILVDNTTGVSATKLDKLWRASDTAEFDNVEIQQRI
jgi:alkylation response protein AidB-like acyl-CoA dehydrogenase